MILLLAFLSLSIGPSERIEYARYAHRHFLPDDVKNEFAGTHGIKQKILWIFSPRCSESFLDNIVTDHGNDMRELEFIYVECWERKANTLPFRIEL